MILPRDRLGPWPPQIRTPNMRAGWQSVDWKPGPMAPPDKYGAPLGKGKRRSR